MRQKNLKHLLYTSVFLLFIPLMSHAQCPNVTIIEGINGDTVVTCNTPQITLHADAFITTQHFNGTYLVESIPYNPPEPFTAGIHLPISVDDIWDSQGGLDIDFPFQFFGVTQTHVYMAANGLVSFNSDITPGLYSGYSWDEYYPINPSTTNPSTFLWPNSILAYAGDMDPAYIPSSETSTRGVFKYSGGEVPCRHITVSWNKVPLFGYSSSQATYHNSHQVVLYEGTNVVEIHVKTHHSLTSTTHVSGVGILNADGTSAFMAPNRNPFNGEIDETTAEAWRFTPQGTTVKTVNWYRLVGGDSIEVGANANAANAQLAKGYYASSDHMSVVVYPTEPSDYMVTVRYNGATGYFYYLKDIIHVDVDTSTSYTIATPNPDGYGNSAVCYGAQGQFQLNIPATSSYESVNWQVTHTQNGQTTILPTTDYQVNGRTLYLPPTATMRENAVDTFHIYPTVLFTNGCTRSDSIMHLVRPNYNIEYHDGICGDQTYTFWGEEFTQTGDYTRTFRTRYGCDSVETLHLSVPEVNRTIVPVTDCRPYTWINGQTYYESNTSTSYVDTVILKNQYGCDSILQLSFTFEPVEARIQANPTSADIDHLNIQLTDISIGSDEREWSFPNGAVSYSQTAYYGFNPSEDSAIISLHIRNHLGCEDDTTITLYLLKENIWIPNAFTPEEETNNRFFVISTGLVYLQMYIYDRRGELVCHFEGIDGTWDGRDTRGEPCKTGSYTYVCRYANIVNPKAILTKRGTITLIR